MQKIRVDHFYIVPYNEEERKEHSSYGRLYAELENGETVEVNDYDQFFQHHAHLTLVKE